MIGELIGKYRIAEQIGEGGMGAVYRAEHVVLGSPAAIKVLLPQWTRNRQVVDRFLSEARAASAIRHAGIVQVFDSGRLANGQAYIAMELLAGSSLADLLERRGPLTPPLALAIGGQILSALDAAHVVGVVHRDLKPDNIQLIRDPSAPSSIRVKLLDFGIAKLLFDAEGRRLPTAGGALLGTPSYMSPEQCAGHQVDARSDLYSVGCILFEMLTGRPPFLGETSSEIVGMHLHEQPPLLRSLEPKLPLELEQLVSRMLDKEPDERTPSAAWALAALERAVLDAPAYEPTAVAAPLVLAAMSAGPPALPGGAVAVSDQPFAGVSYGEAYQPPLSAQYAVPSSGQYFSPPGSGAYAPAGGGAAMRPPGSGAYAPAAGPPGGSGAYASAPGAPGSGAYASAPGAPGSGAYPPAAPGSGAYPPAAPGSGAYASANPQRPDFPRAESWALSMEDDEPPGSTTVAEPLEVAAPKLARISSMMQAPEHDPAEDFGHIDTGNETAIFAPLEDTVEQSVEPSAVEPGFLAPPRVPTPMMFEADLPALLPRAYGPLPRADWAVELPAAPPVRRSWMPYIVVAVAVIIAMAAIFLIARSATLPPAPPLQ